MSGTGLSFELHLCTMEIRAWESADDSRCCGFLDPIGNKVAVSGAIRERDRGVVYNI